MGLRASASFTRPNNTTAYADHDLVANDATAGSVVVPSVNFGGVGGYLRRARLLTSNPTITNGSFLLWLLSATSTVANGDNGALGGVAAAKVLDHRAITLSGAIASVGGFGQVAIPAGEVWLTGEVFLLLQAKAAYTPAAQEVFTIDLEIER